METEIEWVDAVSAYVAPQRFLATKGVVLEPGSNESAIADVENSSFNMILIKLASKEYVFRDFMGLLSEHYDSESAQERRAACLLFGTVLTTLPDLEVRPKELKELVFFISQRLSDWFSVKGLVKAAYAFFRDRRGVMSSLNFTVDEDGPAEPAPWGVKVNNRNKISLPRYLFGRLLRMIHCPGFDVELRAEMYAIMEIFLTEFEKDVHDLGWRICNEICCQVEGERDPRNIAVLFAMLKIFVEKYDVLFEQNEAEEDDTDIRVTKESTLNLLVEVLFSYFPIEFSDSTPRKDHEYASEQQLTSLFYSIITSCERMRKTSIDCALQRIDSQSDLYVAEEEVPKLIECLCVLLQTTASSEARCLVSQYFRICLEECFLQNTKNTEHFANGFRKILEVVMKDTKVVPTEVLQCLTTLGQMLQRPTSDIGNPSFSSCRHFILASAQASQYLLPIIWNTAGSPVLSSAIWMIFQLEPEIAKKNYSHMKSLFSQVDLEPPRAATFQRAVADVLFVHRLLHANTEFIPELAQLAAEEPTTVGKFPYVYMNDVNDKKDSTLTLFEVASAMTHLVSLHKGDFPTLIFVASISILAIYMVAFADVKMSERFASEVIDIFREKDHRSSLPRLYVPSNSHLWDSADIVLKASPLDVGKYGRVYYSIDAIIEKFPLVIIGMHRDGLELLNLQKRITKRIMDGTLTARNEQEFSNDSDARLLHFWFSFQCSCCHRLVKCTNDQTELTMQLATPVVNTVMHFWSLTTTQFNDLESKESESKTWATASVATYCTQFLDRLFEETHGRFGGAWVRKLLQKFDDNSDESSFQTNSTLCRLTLLLDIVTEFEMHYPNFPLAKVKKAMKTMIGSLSFKEPDLVLSSLKRLLDPSNETATRSNSHFANISEAKSVLHLQWCPNSINKRSSAKEKMEICNRALDTLFVQEKEFFIWKGFKTQPDDSIVVANFGKNVVKASVDSLITLLKNEDSKASPVQNLCAQNIFKVLRNAVQRGNTTFTKILQVCVCGELLTEMKNQSELDTFELWISDLLKCGDWDNSESRYGLLLLAAITSWTGRSIVNKDVESVKCKEFLTRILKFLRDFSSTSPLCESYTKLSCCCIATRLHYQEVKEIFGEQKINKFVEDSIRFAKEPSTILPGTIESKIESQAIRAVLFFLKDMFKQAKISRSLRGFPVLAKPGLILELATLSSTTGEPETKWAATHLLGSLLVLVDDKSACEKVVGNLRKNLSDGNRSLRAISASVINAWLCNESQTSGASIGSIDGPILSSK
eukprot:GHVP01023764.1.p1 GENE.GHVP01023764.1~~GHVP01023764.1.p1  ORF type:complete len:1272 (+),score=249.89 GHVP01023764.1:1035-4850(+)